MSTKLKQLSKVKIARIYNHILDIYNQDIINRILKSIKKTSWPEDEKNRVKKALGLEKINQRSLKKTLQKLFPTIAWLVVIIILFQSFLEIYLGDGIFTNFLIKYDLKLRNFAPQVYDFLKIFFSFAGSFVKSPAKFDHPLLLSAICSTSAIILVGAGFKSLVEKFDIGQLKPRSIIKKEQMIKKGTWPVDEIGHILTFGATDTSITEPLMSTLKKHGFVIPVHRGSTNTYPEANSKKLWVCAGFDKTPQTTREMAGRDILLKANCIDASVILVNCIREISIYRPIDVSNTEQSPDGILFPQSADAIFEQIDELSELVYGKDNSLQKVNIAIVSRTTIVGNHLLTNERIKARSLFEEDRDVPIAVIEPEELVERKLVDMIKDIGRKNNILKGQKKAYLLISGDETTDKQTETNMTESLLSNKIIDKVMQNPKEANLIILTSTEDQNTAALVEQYRQELDASNRMNVPIIVIQKRPDKRALPELGHIYLIAIQDLLSQEVDRILSNYLIKAKIPSEVKKKATSLMKIRQKRRITRVQE